MPELPEVKAHTERLNAALQGEQLKRFLPLHPAVLKTFAPRPSTAHSRTLANVGNRGKYLLLRFEAEVAAEPVTFVIHLMNAGRLRVDSTGVRKPRGSLARWIFVSGETLLFTEAGSERKAGIWTVAGDPNEVEPLSRLGPDADSISLAELAQRLAAQSKRIHGFLRNQRNLAGIGRLLSNEVLHAARISPFAITSRLSDTAVARLHQAIGSVMQRALAAERNLKDMGRSKDRPSDVYHRVGKDCPACGDTIRAVTYRKYRVAYCPRCQTRGKVLANNTTSRFLK